MHKRMLRVEMNRMTTLPEIFLSGSWLETEVGIEAGFLLVMETSKGRLVLRRPTPREWAKIERDSKRKVLQAT